jgi:cytochrome c-type biogenesis protein CcmH
MTRPARKRSVFHAAALLLFSLSLWNVAVHAQQATPSDDEVNAIARQLFCPVCENTPLDVCPTEACRQWRDLIRQMLAEGKTADEIKQYFVDNYGARVLSEPPRSGLNWLAYLVPPAAFLLGAFLLFRAFALWRRQAQVAAEAAPPAPRSRRGKSADDGYAARLEDELKKRK